MSHLEENKSKKGSFHVFSVLKWVVSEPPKIAGTSRTETFTTWIAQGWKWAGILPLSSPLAGTPSTGKRKGPCELKTSASSLEPNYPETVYLTKPETHSGVQGYRAGFSDLCPANQNYPTSWKKKYRFLPPHNPFLQNSKSE